MAQPAPERHPLPVTPAVSDDVQPDVRTCGPRPGLRRVILRPKWYRPPRCNGGSPQLRLVLHETQPFSGIKSQRREGRNWLNALWRRGNLARLWSALFLETLHKRI